ncbi:hypothetical protein [Aminipila sp.]|uniref:hypothetical protein n=1 Tax=Aminipila sp. TaxID=2060095 RepID=UPI00289E8314|nr:hypothetical protein [Aminipila sp.]
MYILDIKEKTNLIKGFYGMTIATVFCVLFAVTYNHFGHGVQSFYMTYMFLCPLILGMMFYGAILFIPKAKNISRISFNIYNSGVATLTIGSMLMGIFEIAGTASEYVIAYGVLGSTMLAIGFTTYFLNDLRHG